MLSHWQVECFVKSNQDTQADSIDNSSKQLEKPADPVVVLCLFSCCQACVKNGGQVASLNPFFCGNHQQPQKSITGHGGRLFLIERQAYFGLQDYSEITSTLIVQ